jgi:sugar phosphate isomerase/epimerase
MISDHAFLMHRSFEAISHYDNARNSTAYRGSSMRIDYAVSLWNYVWYSRVPSLERAVAMIRREGFGAEFHIHWQEEQNLYDEIGRERLKPLVEGMNVSLHASGNMTNEPQRVEIVDTAARIGAKAVVVHPNALGGWKPEELDGPMIHDYVDYAGEKGVTIALENGGLAVLVAALEIEPRLGICLDVGHVYLDAKPDLGAYLDALKSNLMHLHVQEVCKDIERDAPGAIPDHYTPGTGCIPREDWELLGRILREIDFEGMAVYEIHPRDPIQTARLATEFLKRPFSSKP